MSLLITLFSIILGTFLSLALGYLFFWVAVFFLRLSRPLSESDLPQNKFAFVVPAHNEESGISATLESLLKVDYPRDLFDVVVVADNCADGTASVARGSGVIVLERYSEDERGKGFALRYAFRSLLSQGYDAFVVIDADSVVDRNFLSVMDSHLESGFSVVQALYGISNPDATPLTYLFHVGNVIENHLFYEAKSRFGFPAILRGNGMCFSRQVLEEFPWDAFSVVEDTEYAIKLIAAGIDIPFTASTRVLAHQPEDLQQAHAQRVRWASGNMKITKGYAFRLIWQGLKNKQVFLADVGISLLVLSKPLLLMGSLLAVSLSLANVLLFQAGGGICIWTLCLLSLLSCYLILGILVGGMDKKRFKYVLKVPGYLCWMLYVTALGLVGYRANVWVRTKRACER